MTKFNVRFFGGLEILSDSNPIDTFESQKSRALFAFLACHRERYFSREFLSGFLWPEEPSEAARRNLRQAIYSLRRTFTLGTQGLWDPLRTSHQGAAFHHPPELTLDVEIFQQAAASTRGQAPPDPALLETAAALYRGDFLEGFFVRDCPPFEDWLREEQERLREMANALLRVLVEHHLGQGSYPLGIRFARQMLHLDPLAEVAHRRLMRLYALSGRREKALATYQELRALLLQELGVAPDRETEQEYQAIVTGKLPDPSLVARAEPVGPLVPLVGRNQAEARLAATWEAVKAGQGRMTLVRGKAGIGKSRLILSFLDRSSRDARIALLAGSFLDLDLPVPFGALAEALGNAIAYGTEVGERILRSIDQQTLATLARLVPELQTAAPQARGRASVAAEELSRSFSHCLERLTGAGSGDRKPLILYLENLQWADPPSLRLLAVLVRRLDGLPLWILVAGRDTPEDLARYRELKTVGSPVEVLELEALLPANVEAIAANLMAREPDRRLLLEALVPCGGLPLTVTETINNYWDAGWLRSLSDGRLELAGSGTDGDHEGAARIGSLTEVIGERVSRLPVSIRRLLSLASLVPHDLDAELLERAEGEHAAVVELGLQLLLERRWIRPALGYWADSRRERDVAVLASHPRRRTFRFAHDDARRALYGMLSPARRQVLHAGLANALLARRPSLAVDWAALAHHALRGEQWALAVPPLEELANVARAVGAADLVARYEATRDAALAHCEP